MLFLLFKLDDDRYAIEAEKVSSVLPLVTAKKIPHAPAAIAGAFTLHGEAIPLVDLSRLTLGRSARRQLSTRIIVTHYPLPDGSTRKLGMIAEQVVETMRLVPEAFVASGISNKEASYLGPVASDPDGLIQWVQIEHLLPDTVRDLLFQETIESC
ncbi:chemotaxis protein CheW [Lysobacter tyrosinilyticus]